jgi:hypothetical protein
MAKKKKDKCSCGEDCKCGRGCGCSSCGCGGAIYGLGFIGATVYYLSTATSLWMGFLGFLKAIVWPAFLVYDSLKFLGM